jgi:hypothetical protein
MIKNMNKIKDTLLTVYNEIIVKNEEDKEEAYGNKILQPLFTNIYTGLNLNEDTGKNTLDTVNFMELKKLVMDETEKTKTDKIKMLIIIKYLYETIIEEREKAKGQSVYYDKNINYPLQEKKQKKKEKRRRNKEIKAIKYSDKKKSNEVLI